MAKIVLGIGMSHSPMMALEGKNWANFAENDFQHSNLFDFEGERVTYEELSKQSDGIYADRASSNNLIALWNKMQQSFARLKDDVAEARPDVVIVVANDHPGEFIDPSNVPALAVFYGDKVVSADSKSKVVRKRANLDAEALQKMSKGMGMDANHEWPGSSKMGLHLIESLMEQNFDVGALKEVKDPTQYGHGHGYGMVVTELMDPDHLIPMVPIYLNTWPPNELSPSRCYDFGKALRIAIESFPDDIRVAVIASGGLSHFVTDADLDEYVLSALRTRSEKDLRNIPKHRLRGGNSEIRNWIVLASAIEHLQPAWIDYLPVYRTPNGTGLGMGFGRWS